MTAISDYQARKFGKGFSLFDHDGDGVVRFTDLRVVARHEAERTGRDYTAPELRPLRTCVERWWQALDRAGRGQVDRDQFVAALIELSADRDRVRFIFEDGIRCLLSHMDSDGDGWVSKDDFIRVTQDDGLTDEERDAAFDSMDADGDGYASIDDLVADYITFYCTLDPDAGCNGIGGFF
ncbi:EF-hand domain-containing protein [Goodfellowiella coeruleoviolacea]|uniref:Ca2+-binding protein, EF-hand superfamily n=1 Tax=Goodfellowiella coeruleoviolacea TaxID=334858 RepID=A0AAE3GH92_9PSEU|nr:EF-hand domain-containing protein [Goodfellowiella coeruleoviolacea]MCP2167688.1 Ca2+-binding protein, EF-hand superfamily [Goodfellowiella coeruleoviolacea]